MNRADRRLEKKFKNKFMKRVETKVSNVLQKYEQPCCYVNNKPVYVGACVFLKKDTEISDQYNWNLNKLIEQNHRFVIQLQKGKIGDLLVVSLLSTSQYLNEEQELGIKLTGKYHDSKYVYMDAKNSYVIKPSCIKSVDYNLSDDDQGRCLMVIKNNRTDKVKLQKGLINDKEVDEAYNYFYEYIFSQKLNEDQQKLLDIIFIRDYVMELPYTMVKLQLVEENERHPDIMKEAFKLLTEGKTDPNTELFDRKLLTLYLATTDDLNLTKVSEIIQKGY